MYTKAPDVIQSLWAAGGPPSGREVYPPKPGEKVILYFHGGSYVGGSAHPDEYVTGILRNILRYTDLGARPNASQRDAPSRTHGHSRNGSRTKPRSRRASTASAEAKAEAEAEADSESIPAPPPAFISRALSVEYRLSSTHPLTPANPFPAALLDAISAYNYLVRIVGFKPENIRILGDSAGGNLALALTRYLVERQEELSGGSDDAVHALSPPGGLILLSPWCDLGSSHDVPRRQTWFSQWIPWSWPQLDLSLVTDYDPPPHANDYAKNAYIGPYGMGGADINRYVSPGSISFLANVNFLPPGDTDQTAQNKESRQPQGWPRTLISAGGSENLLPQIHVLRNRMFRDLGEDRGRGNHSRAGALHPNDASSDIELEELGEELERLGRQVREGRVIGQGRSRSRSESHNPNHQTGKVRYLEAPDVPHDFLLFPWMEPQWRETMNSIVSWVGSFTCLFFCFDSSRSLRIQPGR
jgi:acetyl esterase/lipase